MSDALARALAKAKDVLERPWNNCDDQNECTTDCFEGWHEDRREAIKEAERTLEQYLSENAERVGE